MEQSPIAIAFKPEKLTPETYAHRRNKATQQELESLMHSAEFRAWAVASEHSKKQPSPSSRWKRLLLITLPLLAVALVAGGLYHHQVLRHPAAGSWPAAGHPSFRSSALGATRAYAGSTLAEQVVEASSKRQPGVQAEGHALQSSDTLPDGHVIDLTASLATAQPLTEEPGSGPESPAPVTCAASAAPAPGDMLRQQLEMSTSQLHRSHGVVLMHQRRQAELHGLAQAKAAEAAQLAEQVAAAEHEAKVSGLETARLEAELAGAREELAAVRDELAAHEAAASHADVAAAAPQLAASASPAAGVLLPVGRSSPPAVPEPTAVLGAPVLAALLTLLAATSALIFWRAFKYYSARQAATLAEQEAASVDAEHFRQLEGTVVQLTQDLASTRGELASRDAQFEEVEAVTELLTQLQLQAGQLAADLALKDMQLVEAKACFDELHDMHAKTCAEKDAALAAQAETAVQLRQAQQELSRMVTEQLTQADAVLEEREVLCERPTSNARAAKPARAARNKENSNVNMAAGQGVPRQKGGEELEREELRGALQEAKEHLRDSRACQASLQADLTAAKANLDALSAESATREFMLTEAAIQEGHLRTRVADLLKANALAHSTIADLEARCAQLDSAARELSTSNAALKEDWAADKAQLTSAFQQLAESMVDIEQAQTNLNELCASEEATADLQPGTDSAELAVDIVGSLSGASAMSATEDDELAELRLEASRCHDRISELLFDKQLLEGRLQDAKLDIASLDAARQGEVEDQHQLAEQAASLAQCQIDCMHVDQQLLQDRILDLESSVAETAADKEALTIELDLLRAQHGMMETGAEGAAEEVRQLISLNAALEAEIRGMDVDIAQLTADNQELQARVLSMQAALHDRQLSDVEVELERKHCQVAELHMLQSQLEGQLDKLAAQLQATEACNAELAAQLAAKEAHVAELATQRDAFAQDLTSIKEVKADLEAKLLDKADEMSALASENYNLDAQLEQVTASLGELAASKAECEVQLRQYQQDVHDLSKLYEVAESAKQAMGSEVRMLRAMLGDLAADLEQDEEQYHDHVLSGCPIMPLARSKVAALLAQAQLEPDAVQQSSESDSPLSSLDSSPAVSPESGPSGQQSRLAHGEAHDTEPSAVGGLFAKIGRVARRLGGGEDGIPNAPAPSPAGPHVPRGVINDPRFLSFLENASQRIGALQAAMQTAADSPLPQAQALIPMSPVPVTEPHSKEADAVALLDQRYRELQRRAEAVLCPFNEYELGADTESGIKGQLLELTQSYRAATSEQARLAAVACIQDDLQAELHAARCQLEEAEARAEACLAERAELEAEQLRHQEAATEADQQVQLARQMKVSTEASLTAFEETWGVGEDVALAADLVAAQQNLEACASIKAGALAALEVVLATKEGLLAQQEAVHAGIKAQEQHIENVTSALEDVEGQVAFQTHAMAQAEKAFAGARMALTAALDAVPAKEAAQQAEPADAAPVLVQSAASTDADSVFEAWSSPARGLVQKSPSVGEAHQVTGDGTPFAIRSSALVHAKNANVTAGSASPAKTPTLKHRSLARGNENVQAVANTAARNLDSPGNKLKRGKGTPSNPMRAPFGELPLNVDTLTPAVKTPPALAISAGADSQSAAPEPSPQSPLEKALSLLDEGWFASPTCM